MKNSQIDTLYFSTNPTEGGVGNTVRIDDFQHIVLELSLNGTASMRLHIQGSVQESAPTFSSARSDTNHWEYIYVTDLQSGSNVAGDTGFTFAAADYRLLKLGPVALKWVNVVITEFDTGSPSIKVFKSNND
jgi:hypothetical protein